MLLFLQVLGTLYIPTLTADIVNRGIVTGDLDHIWRVGGFMLLARGIEREGRLWPMSNVFPVTARFCAKPQGLGYVQGTVRAENPFFPPGLSLRGHEFHYSRCQWEGAAPSCALELSRGKGMGHIGGMACDGLTRGRVWAAYTHIFAPAVPCWADNFVAAARRFRQERNGAA